MILITPVGESSVVYQAGELECGEGVQIAWLGAGGLSDVELVLLKGRQTFKTINHTGTVRSTSLVVKPMGMAVISFSLLVRPGGDGRLSLKADTRREEKSVTWHMAGNCHGRSWCRLGLFTQEGWLIHLMVGTTA